MQNKGILMVISGFSGAGKGTLVKKLLSEYDNYALSISMTTRGPREGEQDGREYFFRTREQFEENIAKNGFIEYAQYCGNYYGTPKKEVQRSLDEGKDIILEIEVQGALKVKEIMPEAVLIFIFPPSFEELEKRLVGRNTETPEVIEKRLFRAKEELVISKQYDYIVVNDEIELASQKIHCIIDAEKQKVSRNKKLITEVTGQ
mgnify:CR=1 FL=1